jgi:type II secretory pathway component PulM
MPMEGHWRRVNTPLRRLTPRERGVLIAGSAITAAAILVLLVLPKSSSPPSPERGCIQVNVAGRVGGEPVSACGQEARALCARSARFDVPRSRTILAACREQGIPVQPGIGAPSGRP